MSQFFCDSNCELWFDKLESLDINYISMPYTIDNEEYYYDLGKNTDNREFFARMRKGSAPKTSALNMQNYIDYFAPVLEKGEDIIYVTFSQQMSGTFDSMNNAIAELGERYPDRKITVVDTKHICMAAGIIVYYAAKKHNEGASDAEVVSFVESIRDKVKCYFTVADLVYLKRGGRISAVKAFVGNLLNVKPIIAGVDGRLVNIASSMGRKKSLKDLVGYVNKDGIDTDYPLALMHADNDADAQIVRNNILSTHADVEIWEQVVGPVIGSHCGPDTIGVIFVSK